MFWLTVWEWVTGLMATVRTKAEREKDFEKLKDRPQLAADRAKVASMRRRQQDEAMAPSERAKLNSEIWSLETKFPLREMVIAEAEGRLGKHPLAAEKPLQRRKRQVATLLRDVRWQLEKSAGSSSDPNGTGSALFHKLGLENAVEAARGSVETTPDNAARKKDLAEAEAKLAGFMKSVWPELTAERDELFAEAAKIDRELAALHQRKLTELWPE